MPYIFRKYLTIVFAALLFFCSQTGFAQEKEKATDNTRYAVKIDIQNAYISGISIMRKESDCLKAAMFNEFGISILSWNYDSRKDKIRISGASAFFAKAGIKRVLKSDLKAISRQIYNGEHGNDANYVYCNKKYSLKYSFKAIENEIKG